MSVKFRTMTVGVFHARLSKGWASTTLTLEDTTGDSARRVVIEIDRPSDVQYLRMQLDEIEEYWKKQLAELSNI